MPNENIPKEIKEAIDDPEFIFLCTFSGGKDSVAQFLYLLELGIPKERIHIHHHDVDGEGTQLFDWPCTSSYVEAFCKEFEVDLYVSYREGGILGEMLKENKPIGDVFYQNEPNGEFIRLESKGKPNTRLKWPALAADLRTRWCSSVAKIDVFSRVITNTDIYRKGKLVIITGERRQESNNRSKYNNLEKHRSFTKSRTSWHWRPILEWKEKEVWAMFEKYKIQPHPCYELGWGRCSCQICIFSSPSVWQAVEEIDPAKILTVSALEKKIGQTLHYKTRQKNKVKYHQSQSIKEYIKKAGGKSILNEEARNRWLEEALGDFKSPIKVKGEWKLPAGAFKKESSGAT
jgi:3'-phosphoadenosine 5'-phosphosulfate sulfotransferase (PAPS reductase)/FAD synthetase